jgi:hypothetical protein
MLNIALVTIAARREVLITEGVASIESESNLTRSRTKHDHQLARCDDTAFGFGRSARHPAVREYETGCARIELKPRHSRYEKLPIHRTKPRPT